MRIPRSLLLFALLTSASAPAAVSTQLGVIWPYPGMYFDPNQAGSGLYVDYGPSGALFMTFETYDAAGNQVNLIAQPTYQPSSETDLIASGVIGKTSATFYQASNGQCPGCAYRAPVLTPTSLAADFTWSDPRHVAMTFGAYTYHLQAANYEGKDDEEFVPGTYALGFVNDDSVYPGAPKTNVLATELAIVRIAPAPFGATQLVRDPASSADIQLPPAGAHLYTMECAGNQSGADDNACNSTLLIFTNAVPGSQRQSIPRGTAKALVWFDPGSGGAGFDLYQTPADGSIQIGPANLHGRVYITPGSLRTHLQAQAPPHIAAVTDGFVAIALTFTRLPDNAVRDCYDYPASVCQ